MSSVDLLDELITTYEITQQKNNNDPKRSYPQTAHTLIRQYSGDLNIPNNNDNNNNDFIFSLSDDEHDDETKYENMIDIIKQQISTQHYAKLDTTMKDISKKCINLILGFTRIYYKGSGAHIMPNEILSLMCNYYPPIHLFCWNNKYISLKSSEEENANIFVIAKSYCVLSNLLKPFIESKIPEMVQLKEVNSNILELVVQYLAYHKGIKPLPIEKPLRSSNMEIVCNDIWDANYVNCMEQETIFCVILAANYMDLPPLLDLSCAKIASEIKGKSPEEIRQKFNIENDFSPEEEEAVRAENRWAEDL